MDGACGGAVRGFGDRGRRGAGSGVHLTLHRVLAERFGQQRRVATDGACGGAVRWFGHRGRRGAGSKVPLTLYRVLEVRFGKARFGRRWTAPAEARSGHHGRRRMAGAWLIPHVAWPLTLHRVLARGSGWRVGRRWMTQAEARSLGPGSAGGAGLAAGCRSRCIGFWRAAWDSCLDPALGLVSVSPHSPVGWRSWVAAETPG